MLYIHHDQSFTQYDQPSLECPEFSFGIQSKWQPTATSLPVNVTGPSTNDEWTINQDLPTTASCPTAPPVATFSDYLATLDPWEQQLFESLELNHTCYDLIQIISTPPSQPSTLDINLISISDGSCTGPAHGSKQSSFWAEGYGLLSIVCFLHHLFQFCDCRPSWLIHLSCDNDPLVNRVESTRSFKQCFPNLTLDADWDVVNMIVRTIRQSPCTIRITHVKGHQDDKTRYLGLPLNAQLNCDADHEAVYIQTFHATYRPMVPMILTNAAQFHIHGCTINSGYKTAIRNAYSEPALLLHIQTRNKWSQITMATVNLASLKQALNRMSSRHIQLVKLCHDILPTAKLTHWYSPIVPDYCPLCKSETKDLSHLLKCDHPDRAVATSPVRITPGDV
jgi:hypothetical protein